MCEINKYHTNQPMGRYMNVRAGKGEAYKPTPVEHMANILTHGMMIVPSTVAATCLVQQARSLPHSLVAVVYGPALVLLFFVSAAFHVVSAFNWLPQWKNFFHIGDRAVIYLFIAASYTPWLTLRDFDGVVETCTLVIVWTCAILGIAYQYIFHEQYKLLEVIFYLAVGILPAISIIYMPDHTGVYELVLGGAMYVSGVAFFKADGRVPCAHAIWHCFVTGGAAVHYYAVSRYLYHVDPLAGADVKVEV